MIELTRLNGKSFVANCEMIRTIEATPDTVITFYDGSKFMVLESVSEVIERTIRFRRAISASPLSYPAKDPEKWI